MDLFSSSTPQTFSGRPRTRSLEKGRFAASSIPHTHADADSVHARAHTPGWHPLCLPHSSLKPGRTTRHVAGNPLGAHFPRRFCMQTLDLYRSVCVPSTEKGPGSKRAGNALAPLAACSQVSRGKGQGWRPGWRLCFATSGFACTAVLHLCCGAVMLSVRHVWAGNAGLSVGQRGGRALPSRRGLPRH